MNRSGFTLIELLVVTAIIAVLAAILFPVFVSAKEHARVARCLSNLRNLSSAFRLYADDHDGGMPSAHYTWASPDWCGTVAWQGDVAIENGPIWNYTKKSKGIYLCPSDIGVAPAYMPSQKNYPLSYSMNWKLHLSSMDRVIKPSRVLLLIHEGRQTIDDGCFYWLDDTTRNLPSKIHYDGTAASYVDGHAKWLSYKALRQERADRWWDPDVSK